MNKIRIIEAIIEQLTEQLHGIQEAARAAHEAATHEESKPEDEHDTRGIEASYLAGAQSQRALEIQQMLSTYRQMRKQEYSAQAPIGPGALVELEHEGKRSHCLLVPHGGGTTVKIEGISIQVISPESPLGDELVGRRAGDSFEMEIRQTTKEYEILSVQ